MTSRFACETEEDDCRAETVCGETIFCRPQDFCRAIPTCADGEIESLNSCFAHETTEECHAVTICSNTIICRQQ